jgi:hypothetical protein
MNEHIKLLKEQAMEWVPNMADPDTKIRLLNAGKFAELIVRECEEVVRWAISVDSTIERVPVLIREHFGVEE